MTKDKSPLQKDIEAQRALCDQNVQNWTAKLSEAEQQLKYWKMQQEAILTISTRLMLDNWAAEAKEKKNG